MNDHAPHKLILGPRNIFWIALSIAVLALVAYVIKSGHEVTGISVPGVIDVKLGSEQASGTPVTPSVAVAPNTGMVNHNQLEQLSQQELKLRQLEIQEKIAQAEARLKASQAITSTNSAAFIPPAPKVNLSGLWTGHDGVQYNISQVGDEITFQEMNPLLGVTIVADGEINGNQVDLQYTSMLGSNGYGELTLSTDGKRLNGSFYDNVFNVSTALSLRR